MPTSQQNNQVIAIEVGKVNRQDSHMDSGTKGTILDKLDVVAAVAFIVLCAVGIAVGISLLWTRGASAAQPARAAAPKPSARPSPALPPTPVDVTDAIALGNKTAKVTIIEYSDFKCPYCGAFARDTWPEIQKRYVETGKVRFIFRNLPLDQLHPFARQAAQTAVCAERQGKFWQLHDLMFARQAQLDAQELQKSIALVGLDWKKLSQCLSSDASRLVGFDEAAGRPLGVTGTPTFFVGLSQGDGRVLLKQRLTGAQSVAQFQAAFDRLLSEAAPGRP